MGPLHLRLALPGAAMLALTPFPAQAQLDDSTVAAVMAECRKIADHDARMACYDNIPLGTGPVASAGSGAAASAPAPTASPAPPAPPAPPPAQQFGSNQLPRERTAGSADQAREAITASVTDAAERSPGIYLLTLDNGTQWQLVDAAPPSYNPPWRGSDVEIASAAMGSYMLRYDGQRGLRIRRVK